MSNESPIANSADAPKATRREWVGLAVLALPCLLYSMDLTVLNLAVPHLSADLQPSGAQLLWIVDIYGFLVGGSLITMGTLGDRIGRRRLLLIGAVAFGAASVLAAFSFTAPMLIAARAILGVASATLAPSTLSLIRNMFLDPRERTFAVGVWIASFSAGGALGPLLGGLLLEHFWWGSVFLVNVPVMLLLLAVGPRLLPEYRDPNPGRLDPISAALSLVAVLAVIYGIKRIAEGGHVWLSVAVMIVGVVIGVVFVQRQKALADPLIDLSLFKSVAFSASLAINIVGFFVAFGTFLFIAQYLAARARNEPAPGGTLDGAIRSGIHCRVDAGTGAGAPNAADARHRMRFWSGGSRVCHPDPDRTNAGTVGRCDRLRHPVAGTVTRVHDGHRSHCRDGAARARRYGSGALGNKHRIRWCAGHCDPR